MDNVGPLSDDKSKANVVTAQEVARQVIKVIYTLILFVNPKLIITYIFYATKIKLGWPNTVI